jgi:hypothetical protein
LKTSNKKGENKMKDKEAYIRLSQSLDSLRDVAFAEIRLIESEAGKTQFSNFVTGKVKVLLGEIAKQQKDAWLKVNNAQAQKFIDHAQALLSAKAPSSCPPGFVEVNGICVPI